MSKIAKGRSKSKSVVVYDELVQCKTAIPYEEAVVMPSVEVIMIEDTIARVIAERSLYPFPLSGIRRNSNGSYTAW